MSKIAEVFDDACSKNAKKDAIYFYDKTLRKRTYSELKIDIDSCINYLITSGVKSVEFTSFQVTSTVVLPLLSLPSPYWTSI